MKKKHICILSFCLILGYISSSHGKDSFDYWTLKLPVLEGAVGLEYIDDFEFASKSVTYEMEISSTDTINKFYDNYFESIGWQNPMKDFPSSPMLNVQGGWGSFAMNFNENGKPIASYGSIWKAENMPANGRVVVLISDYKEGLYSAKVEVAISPEFDLSPLLELQQLLSKDPKNFFILSDVVKGNPFDIANVEILDQSDYKGNEAIVNEYYKAINKIIESLADFKSTYLNQ